MILAVRHPRPLVPSSICYGQTDVDLAEPVARSLPELQDATSRLINFTIISSPLKRARLVAEAISETSGYPLKLDKDLMELDFGTWEGMAWTDVPRHELDAWAADPMHYRPGGKESPADLFQRVSRFWSAHSDIGENQLWLTHAGPLRCLLALSQGRPFEDCLTATFDYGSTLVCR